MKTPLLPVIVSRTAPSIPNLFPLNQAPMSLPSSDRLQAGYARVRELLLSERVAAGNWVGELSTSALSTATAVMALEQVRSANDTLSQPARPPSSPIQFESLIQDGLKWLVEHQNSDGGWGDTTASFSNISTTMLCHAVFHATQTVDLYPETVRRAHQFIDQQGGIPALRRRYGRDKTFSIPILTHCALAGLVDWREISALPFELACLPHRFYKFLKLPVVSYALPALIAIGQCRFHHRPTWHPLVRLVRNLAIKPSLRKLQSIQPESGGFLEAAPLTSFVTMSLASIGQSNHPVAKLGIQFLVESVRPDGSWPIDTNLATWVTTLSINALGGDLPGDAVPQLTDFLARQQYRTVHHYTQAEPGGWAWTNLSGGVPDSDDTPGAILAAIELTKRSGQKPSPFDLSLACRWLLDLQNHDGGWPTFCRGWGALPFDRSAPDLTAHAIRALSAAIGESDTQLDRNRIDQAIKSGFKYLTKTQRKDGSWLPLWFGNQHNVDDENPTYGTSRVLAAYRDTGRMTTPEAANGLNWLVTNQNQDGSWSGSRGLPPSIEETSLALDIVLSAERNSLSVQRGLTWLLEQIESGEVSRQSPIGFYFAKLWYSEKLYPLCFATQAMRRAVETCNEMPIETN